ncbi:sensor histidine kinase [Brevibacterium sp. GP-SGM9]|uniref:sensor histidine kinase n=1 Tax=Brevibacterium sp. GP-SGM9 TaxID=3376990 RepID=UPI0039A4D0DC
MQERSYRSFVVGEAAARAEGVRNNDTTNAADETDHGPRRPVCYCHLDEANRARRPLCSAWFAEGESVAVVINQLFDRFLPPNRRLNPVALAWVAVILTAIGMLAIESSIAVGLYEAPVALALLVTLIHVGCLPLSMLRPLFGAIASSLACGVLPLLGPSADGAPWPWMVPMMITQTFVILILGLRAHWGIALAALLGSIGSSAAAAMVGRMLFHAGHSDAAIVNIVIFSCIAGGVYVAAVIVQQWQLIRSQLIQEQENTAEEHSKRVAIEEKTRIARELHDIVAHSMSIINIQASSAPFRHAGIDAEVAREFDDISVSARHALTEMRGLLSVLRNDEGGHELAPQPKLSDIDELVRKAQQAGVSVTLERSGERIDQVLRESTGLAGYRIVQEGLSNAIRHARDSEISIRIRGSGSAVRISIVNTSGRGPGDTGRQGDHRSQGLIGMRERAASVGGEIRSGWTEHGTFEVEAVLPLTFTDPGHAQTGPAQKTDPGQTDRAQTDRDQTEPPPAGPGAHLERRDHE